MKEVKSSENQQLKEEIVLLNERLVTVTCERDELKDKAAKLASTFLDTLRDLK
jgi:lipoate synthase